MPDYLEAADRGAAWLDTIVPKWYNHVDPDQLDIANWSKCVIGQLFRSGISSAISPPHLAGSVESKLEAWRHHGFLCSEDRPWRLNNRWRMLINDRRTNTSHRTELVPASEKLASSEQTCPEIS